MISALSALSASDRRLVGVILRRIMEIESICGAQAAHNMLGDLEQAVLLSDP